MARLAATNSIAYVLGPAVSAALISVSLRFPFFVAGGVSGIAFFLSFFFLKESNTAYLLRKQHLASSPSDAATSDSSSASASISKKKAIVSAPSEKVHFKPIMPFCFFLEFCTSWTSGCCNSRYAIYLSDKFGVSTTVYATMLCIMGVWSFLLQSFLYPCLSTRCNFPVPHLAAFGMFLEAVSHVAIALARNAWMGFAPHFFFMLGWSLVCPASTSILSVLLSLCPLLLDELSSLRVRQASLLGQLRHAVCSHHQPSDPLAGLQLEPRGGVLHNGRRVRAGDAGDRVCDDLGGIARLRKEGGLCGEEHRDERAGEQGDAERRGESCDG